MKLISWNMNVRPANWAVLGELMSEHDAEIGMLQEAVRPGGSLGALRVIGDPSLGSDPWRMPIPTGTKRKFACALAVRKSSSVEPHEPKDLARAAYGAPAISHPGQWVAAAVGAGAARTWVVTLYGMFDKMNDSGDIYAEASLHRAISDLTPLLQERATKRVVLAGDLNIWRGYGGRVSKSPRAKMWEARYKTVFDRLEAYGLTLAGPTRCDGPALAGCPCERGDACGHVRTYRHQRRSSSIPYQNDYVFTRGVKVARCVALDEERYWKHSDHCPLLIEIA